MYLEFIDQLLYFNQRNRLYLSTPGRSRTHNLLIRSFKFVCPYRLNSFLSIIYEILKKIVNIVHCFYLVHLGSGSKRALKLSRTLFTPNLGCIGIISAYISCWGQWIRTTTCCSRDSRPAIRRVPNTFFQRAIFYHAHGDETRGACTINIFEPLSP